MIPRDAHTFYRQAMFGWCNFALAAPVERHRHGAPRYKIWVLALHAGVILSLGWLAWQGQSLLEQRGHLYGLELTAGLLLTWADIPLNALTIRLISVHQRLLAGSYIAMPPGMRHYALAEGETVVQLTSVGPWQLNYFNPADDPRR